jgi:hypothetical protein
MIKYIKHCILYRDNNPVVPVVRRPSSVVPVVRSSVVRRPSFRRPSFRRPSSVVRRPSSVVRRPVVL